LTGVYVFVIVLAWKIEAYSLFACSECICKLWGEFGITTDEIQSRERERERKKARKRMSMMIQQTNYYKIFANLTIMISAKYFK
jgi:hypothetical protein